MNTNSAELHWCEGLFLQPHHFQYFQRFQEARLSSERKVAVPYDYGIIEATLLEAGLANKLVRFESLQVILPDGQFLHLGENCTIDPIDIAAEFDRSPGSLTIWLALPLWSRESANLIQRQSDTGGMELRQFKVENRQWRDENTGDDPQDIAVRHYNPRLVAGPKPPSNFTCIPVLKLIRGTGQKLGVPVPDPTFIPPCVLARGFPPLLGMVDEIAMDCQSSFDLLSRNMRGAGFNPERVLPIQLMELLRLSVLGRYSARLTALRQVPACRPIELFIELCSLLTELQALRPDNPPSPVPAYNHDSPGPAFHELYLRIRKLTQGSVSIRFREVPFELREHLLAAKLERQEVIEPCEFLLAVDSPADIKQVADLVEDRARFKVMSPSAGYAAIPGVKLFEERAPIGLPARGNRYFFRLHPTADQESTEMWKRIAAEGAIVLNWRELEQHQAKKMLVPTLFVVRSSQRQEQ